MILDKPQLFTKVLNIAHVMAIFAGEYFAYLGFRSLFILYLTEKMLFTDQMSFEVYGTLTSLIYITPILGGFLAEHVLGHKQCVVIGSLLMMMGYLLLGFYTNNKYLFGCLAIIICGSGFFRSNIVCLLGNLYKDVKQDRDSGFVKFYLVGYIGAFIATIICGMVAMRYGWSAGFILTAIGMGSGILLFLLPDICNIQGILKIENFKKMFDYKNKYLLTIVVAIPLSVLNYIIFITQTISVCMILILPIVILILFKIYYDNRNIRTNILVIVSLIFLSFAFWMLDHQGGSSLNLFIKRVVDRSFFSQTIPASMFQSIGLLAAIFGGLIVTTLWKYLARKQIKLNTFAQISLGNLCLVIGFTVFVCIAKYSADSGCKSSFIYAVIALLIIGIAEVFISPIVMSKITAINIQKATSSLIGIYILLCGSVANYVASKFATWSDIAPSLLNGNVKIVASLYYQAFLAYLIFALIILIISLSMSYLLRKSENIDN